MTDKSINLAAAAAVLVALAVPALSGCGSRNAVAAGVAVGAPAEKLANTYRKRLPIDLDESHKVIDVLSSTKNDSVTFTFGTDHRQERRSGKIPGSIPHQLLPQPHVNEHPELLRHA